MQPLRPEPLREPRSLGRAVLSDGRWTVDVEPHVAIRMKRLFKKGGRTTPGRIILEHSPEVARDLEWFAQRYRIDFDPPEILAAAAQEHREQILRLEDYFSTEYEARSFELAIPPRSYQSRQAEICLDQGFLMSADEVGLGKTCTAICVLAEAVARPAVVVTLTHLPKQWSYEIGKFAPKLNVHVVLKATPYPLDGGLFGSPDIVVLSYSKLAGWAQVLASFARCIVFDEIQELRHDGSAKYGAAQHVAGAAKYRIGLSATPIYNYGSEIFSVLQILKPGLLGAWEEFLREWCVPAGGGKHRLENPRAFGSWARENFAIIRHTRRQVGRELPEVVKVVHTVEADDQPFNEIASAAEALAQLILSAETGERGERLRASEELDWRLRQATGIAKAPYVAAFVRILVESGERVVLCGWHRSVYDVWEDRLRDLGIAYYTGSESPAKKEESKRRFLAGEVKVLFLSLRSGAGLNDLQDAASVIVFGELDWSPGVHEQCVGRIHRDGQQRNVVAYYLITDEGSDPTIVQVLGLKRDQVEGIRDPHRPLVEQVEQDGGGRIKRLALDYLNRRKRT